MLCFESGKGRTHTHRGVWDPPAHGVLQVDFPCASQAAPMETLPSPCCEAMDLLAFFSLDILSFLTFQCKDVRQSWKISTWHWHTSYVSHLLLIFQLKMHTRQKTIQEGL